MLGDDENDTGALRTFLIADIRGYTRFTHEHGDEEAAELAGRFADLARRGITEHGGELLELRGDEALGVFGSAREALRAAVDLQRLFRGATDGEPPLPLGVGIGLDVGEAVPVAGGYRGGALNLAARLCSLAGPGEILCSETVASLARRVEGIRLEPRGSARLKGLEGAVKVLEVIPETPLPHISITRYASLRRFRRRHLTRRRAASGAIVALVAAAGATIVLVLVLGTGLGPISSAAATTRVGLILPREPRTSDDAFAQYVDGLLRAGRQHELETETLVVNPSQSRAPKRVSSRLGDFDLVLVGGQSAHEILLDEVPRHPDTRFVFLDPDPSFNQLAPVDAPRTNFPNANGIFFIEGPASYLAGYLGGLMEEGRVNGGGNAGPISVIGVTRDVSENVVAGFVGGATAAAPQIKVLVDYSGSFSDPAICEKIANRQIDQGSRIVFAAAGTCSLGALSAAGVRGVWGIGADVDRAYLGSHVLVSVVKRVDRAVEYVARSFIDGTLESGRMLDIGIERDAMGIAGISPQVPPDIRRKVALATERIRKEWAPASTP